MTDYLPMQTFYKIKNYFLAHKILGTIAVIVILGGGYFAYKKLTAVTGEVHYTLTNVKKGTLVTSITSSGQILASNQVDIKPKASGEIVWVGVKPGDVVRAGQALASIDSTTAQRAVVSAEQNLVTSKLQLQKDSASAPIDYQKANDALVSAKEDLNTTYNDTFNSLSNTYLDLTTVIAGSQNIIYGYDLNSTGSQWNSYVLNDMFNSRGDDAIKINGFVRKAISDYTDARAKYDASVLVYKQTIRSSSQSDIQSLLDTSIDTTTSVAQTLQSELNMLGTAIDLGQYYNVKIPTAVTTMQTSAKNYLSTVNNDLSSLLAQKKAIINGNQAIKNAQQNVTLIQVGNTSTGDNPISLQIEKNNITSQEQSLSQLKQDLGNYTIVSPFAGTISAVNVKLGDNAGSAAVASVITNQTLAQISLNEVDVAKIKLGDKATMTLDAIDGLTITGSIVEIDSVGAVSQGVVSYTVKINFDTQDSRIRPGMTVNASIQTGVHPDVLYVPSSAVKNNTNGSYVMAFTPPIADSILTAAGTTGVTSKVLPVQVPVQIGISDDASVEITSGLTENEQIVARTITATTKTTTAAPSATSLLGGGGATRGGIGR